MDAVTDEAVAAIRAGKPIVLPMDTVYGLCADPFREGPTRRVYRLKGRESTQPSALVCSDLQLLFEFVPELRGQAATIARALLPGPYTLVLPNPARRFPWLTGSSRDTIGVRVPLLPAPAESILLRLGAVMATSANEAGGIEAARLEDISEKIRNGCGAVVDGGVLPGVPSTVIDFTGREPKVLREGAVPTAEALARAGGTG